jgi:hypothetical protein
VLGKGKAIEKVADFSTGELSVHVLRNGQLSDATVAVYQPGTKTQVAGGRTYRAASSNPKIITLTPGAYDIAVGSVEMANPATRRFENVAVKPGERVELKHEYQSGNLRVGARNGTELIDATVAVYLPGQQMQVAGGRTYTEPQTNPKEFILVPGVYRVAVAPVRPPGKAKKELQVQVAAGQTVEQTADFSQ